MTKILVIGDVMIDEYVYVMTSRMSPEADIPIWDVFTSETCLGGAANVAANVAAQLGPGGTVELAGIMAGDGLRDMLGMWNVDYTSHSVFGQSMLKLRYVSWRNGDHLARVDPLPSFHRQYVEDFNSRMADVVSNVEDYDVIVFSDYDKGTISESLAEAILRPKPSECTVIVDSKRKDLRCFEGADILNINEEEYSEQVSSRLYKNVEGLFGNVVVTLGERGAQLRTNDPSESSDTRYVIHQESFKTFDVSPVDVTGCGDTHTAAMAVALARDPLDVRSAIRYANRCATLAVQIERTAVVTRWDYLKNFGRD